MDHAEKSLREAVKLSGKTEQELFSQYSHSLNYHDFAGRKAVVLSEAAAEILKASEDGRLTDVPQMMWDAAVLLEKAIAAADDARQLAQEYAAAKKAAPPVQMSGEDRIDCPPGYRCM